MRKQSNERAVARSWRARRGTSLYLVVMGVAMLVGVMALASSEITRATLRRSHTNNDAQHAALGARSGLEYALNWMNRTPDWRNRLTSGVDSAWINTYGSRIRFRVTDQDGDLADDARDHAVLRCTARYGDATAVMEVDIEPAGRAISCLDAAVFAGGDVCLKSGSTLQGSGIAAANNNVEVVGADLNLDAEAVNLCTGSNFNAEQTDGVRPRELPGDHVFDWYLKVGTEVAITDLSDVFGTRLMQWDSFSRWVNTHGEPNPHGVYWIDCQSENVAIKWGRQLGTLVLLNPGSSTRVDDVCLLQAEAQNRPVLMVDGDIGIDLRTLIIGQELQEGLLRNYNPQGMPYLGVEDNDQTDQYPARLDGIVYATGAITFTDASDVQGCVVAGGNVVINDNRTVTVDYRPYAYNYPPPGFSAGTGARALPYTWRRVPQ